MLIVILVSGCSSSSSSARYGKQPPEILKPEKPSVRFTSNEKNAPAAADTLSVKPEIYLDSQPEFDETPPADFEIDYSPLISKVKNFSQLNSALTKREKVLLEIIKYLETPYKYGGESTNGIDCSAFTKNVFGSAISFNLPRTTSEQFKIGDSVNDKTELKFGDLLFFNTTKRSYPGHVGIYIGEELFAHASRSRGVTVSSLTSDYFKKRFIDAKRVAEIN